MTTSEIIPQLSRLPDKADFAPYEAALRAAEEQREALTPELIAAIDRVAANPEPYLKEHEESLFLFAIYLLAQFRETRAQDAFVRFFSLPGEQALDLTGDMVTERGAAILASVCGGDPAPLLRLVHDESVNEYVRTQAIEALAVQALWGERPREAAVEDLRRLFQTLPKPGDANVWSGLVYVVSEFHVTELAVEARKAFEEDLVDESIIDLDWLEECLSSDPEENLGSFRRRNATIDAVAGCSGWQCFSQESEEADWRDRPAEFERESLYNAAPVLPPLEGDFGKPTPYIAPRKVGRNDPCPCGSGKKYKKCCG